MSGWDVKRLFDTQFEFLLEVHPDFDRQTLGQKIQMTKDHVLHGMSEFTELLDEVKWKTWLTTQAPPDVNSLTEEAVDVFKFVLNILLTWGVTPADFVKAFDRKSEVNIQRFLQHRQLSKITALVKRTGLQQKVAALDLDGVLAAYPEHWLSFLARSGELVHAVELDTSRFSLVTGVPGVPREKYTKLKHTYRQEGFEAEVPALPGASAFVNRLKALGYLIVIITARPAERYKRLYSDTIRWLMENKIPYDAVMFDMNKEDRIIKDLPVVEFVLDDDPTNVERLSKAGIRAFLFDRPYNQGASGARVMSYDDLLESITKGI